MRSITFLPREVRYANLIKEGIDPNCVHATIPIWSAEKPKGKNVQSALLRDNLIGRSDGSVVYLDVNFSLEVRHLAYAHLGEQRIFPAEFREYILTAFPEFNMIDVRTDQVLPYIRTKVPWEVYVNRLSTVTDGGLLRNNIIPLL